MKYCKSKRSNNWRDYVDKREELKPGCNELDYGWSPFIHGLDICQFFPKGVSGNVDNILKEFFTKHDYVTKYSVDISVPGDGKFRLEPSDGCHVFTRDDIRKLIWQIAYIFNITQVKEETSPTIKMMEDDSNRIDECARSLYNAINSSNHFLKIFFHDVEMLNGDYHDIFIKAEGRELPSHDMFGFSNPNAWNGRLIGLRMMMGCVNELIEFRTGTKKGKLYQKVFGTPEFILVLNCYILRNAIFGKPSGARGGWVARLAEQIRTYATGIGGNSDWTSNHIKAIHKWELAKNKVSSQIDELHTEREGNSSCEAPCLCLVCEKLADLERMRRWLAENPGMVPSGNLSRGNVSPFFDPLLTSCLQDSDHLL